MKKLIIFLCFTIFAFKAEAQSPYLSVALLMTDTSKTYVIEMKLTELKRGTKYNDWFKHERSTIDFTALKDSDFVKSDYLETYNNDNRTFKYTWGNQKMGFEVVIVMRILQGDNEKPMFVIVPIMTKSFTTFIKILNVPFKAGTYYELFIKDEFSSGLKLTHDFNIIKILPVKKRTIQVPLE